MFPLGNIFFFFIFRLFSNLSCIFLNWNVNNVIDCDIVIYEYIVIIMLGEPSKKNYQILDIVQTWGGGQRRSQTFYRKKVWTCFKGGGGSKGLVQSSFL